MSIRNYYIITGQVQGVGFRPFIYNLANSLNIIGYVANTDKGLIIEAQASHAILQNFYDEILKNHPPMAQILSINIKEIPTKDEHNFTISQTQSAHIRHNILIGADIAHCEECKKELLNKENKLYLYPFINCTNCGPRYSITHSLPYDRHTTSMACFPLCDTCKEEYNNPKNRRFHAQPTACHKCGVDVWTEDDKYKGYEAIKRTISNLEAGFIVAIKGIGGFHLACNALLENSIELLRTRKNRPHKALAIMVQDIESARKYAYIDEYEENLLTSPRRPIVICKSKENLPSNINPDTNTIGIMLPSSPLHELLFYENTLEVLIMTSANTHGKPIAISNREANANLKNIADYFLYHNRDILVRVDDSLIMPKAKEIRNLETNKTSFTSIRRARGYVPECLILNDNFKSSNILALGGDLKATSCIIKDNKAFVSQHIGNMEIVENQIFMQENIQHMQNILAIKPEQIIIDAHPNAYMREYADYLAKKYSINCLEVQHHIAHAYALLADNNIFEPLCLLTLDGTGYGLDNTSWGGELFFADPTKAICTRIGSFEKVLQPAFDTAVKNPYYMLEAYLHKSSNPLSKDTHFLSSLSLNYPNKKEIQELCKANIGLYTSSCGRLFDAIAALCSCTHTISYEGQAAMQLEALQDLDYTHFDIVSFSTDEFSILNTQNMFDNCLNLLNKLYKDPHKFNKLARYFHLSLAYSLSFWDMAKAKEYNIDKIGLTGGVFLNTTLLTQICQILEKHGYKAIIHQNYSPTDASISLGQAYFALCKHNI